MNKERRRQLELAEHHIDVAYDLIQCAMDDEHDCLDNMPENLQESERYAKMEDAVDHLSDALESLNDAKDELSAARE